MPNSQKVSFRVRPIGRLDKETSGIVLFAKNQVAAQRLQAQREEHIFRKEYLAVVVGYLPEDPADLWHTISFPVKKVSDHPLRMQAVPDPNDNCHADASLLPAVAHYCTLYSTAKLVTGISPPGYRPHASDPCPYESSRTSASGRYFVL